MSALNIALNISDKDDLIAVSTDGLSCSSTEARWLGARASHGIRTGLYYFEVCFTGAGQCRVGWSTSGAHLQLGKDALGFGLTSAGGKYSNNTEKKYGSKIEDKHIIGCFLDRVKNEISFSLNGLYQGVAFKIPATVITQALFPALAIKAGGSLSFNFGKTPFVYNAEGGYKAIFSASEDDSVEWNPSLAPAAAAPREPKGEKSSRKQGSNETSSSKDKIKYIEPKNSAKAGGVEQANSRIAAENKGDQDFFGNLKPAASSSSVLSISPPEPPQCGRLNLFDHLLRKPIIINRVSIASDRSLHPATSKLGDFFAQGFVRDDDDRVAALIEAVYHIIADFTTSPNKDFLRELEKYIKVQELYLSDCRPHSIGMANFFRHVLAAIPKLPRSLSESEAKKSLLKTLKTFLEERILFARKSIIKYCDAVVKEHDVVLTFGSSPLVRQVLLALASQKRFRLIVIDARPLNDGIDTLSALSPHVRCIYSPLSGVPALMNSVTRVLLGASGLLSNGAMVAPAGTAMVAAIARARGVPVIVAAESYKFSERAQLDSIVGNELGDPEEVAAVLATPPPPGATGSAGAPMASPTTPGSARQSSAVQVITQQQSGYRGSLTVSGIGIPRSSSSSSSGGSTRSERVQVINLRYDLTPMRHISAVATEVGLIPPTSIPVVIAEYRDLSKVL